MVSHVNERPLGMVTTDKEGIVDTINVSPSQLVFGRSKKAVPVNIKLKEALEKSCYDAIQCYKQRDKVMKLFWNEFISGYQRKLKFTPKWLTKFDKEIPKNTYVLLKEKTLKPGRFIPAVVTDVHRRKDGLISRLKLKTTEHKGIVERDIRSIYLPEHQYLMLTENAHKCVLQDLDNSNKKWELPVSHLLYHSIIDDKFDINSWCPKRGPERIYSTQHYVQP